MPPTSAEIDVQLLPRDRTFYELLWPYVIPYMVYVAVSSIPESMLSAELGQMIKLPATAAALIYFRKFYRLGQMRPVHWCIALLALPAALLSWIAPFYLLESLGVSGIIVDDAGNPFPPLHLGLKLVNTVVLVAIFEELLMRVYVLGWFYEAGREQPRLGIFGSIVRTLDRRPSVLNHAPLSRFSVVGATIVFTAGHHAHEYLSAVFYFLFTSWLYAKTRSLWVCVLVHGLTNLSLALLAAYGGMGWLG